MLSQNITKKFFKKDQKSTLIWITDLFLHEQIGQKSSNDALAVSGLMQRPLLCKENSMFNVRK